MGRSSRGKRDVLSGPVVKNPPAKARDTVWSLVWEDSTYCEAAKAMRHSYWSPRALETAPQQKKPQQKTTHHSESSPCSAQLEKAHTQQRRPSTAKNKYINKLKKKKKEENKEYSPGNPERNQ